MAHNGICLRAQCLGLLRIRPDGAARPASPVDHGSQAVELPALSSAETQWHRPQLTERQVFGHPGLDCFRIEKSQLAEPVLGNGNFLWLGKAGLNVDEAQA